MFYIHLPTSSQQVRNDPMRIVDYSLIRYALTDRLTVTEKQGHLESLCICVCFWTFWLLASADFRKWAWNKNDGGERYHIAMWQWTSRTSEIGTPTMALLMFWGSTKATMATSNWCLGLEWESNAPPKLPCLLLSCPIRLFHQVLSYLLLSSSTSSIMFHSASFDPSNEMNVTRCHESQTWKS